MDRMNALSLQLDALAEEIAKESRATRNDPVEINLAVAIVGLMAQSSARINLAAARLSNNALAALNEHKLRIVK